MTYAQARATDPGTSHAAAARVDEFRDRHHRLILEALAFWGPMGKDGIARACGLTGVAISRRLIELERSDLINLTGRKVQSDSGRQEREWDIA
jgi:predicted ArsR family transcriptional regulator